MSIKHVSFDDYGYIASASLTGSYQLLATLTDDCDVLIVFNTSSVDFILQVPNKSEKSNTISTKEIRFLASQPAVLDFRSNKKRLAAGQIQIKHAGAAGTGGISVTAFR